MDKDMNTPLSEWAKLDGVALATRGIEYLSELDWQRSRCTLAGHVEGIMKDCKIVSVTILMALTEKMSASGDVQS